MNPVARSPLRGRLACSGALLLALLCGCTKMKLDAKSQGLKAGETSIVIVHVKTDKGASVDCLPAGLECKRTDADYKGEADIEVDVRAPGASSKTVFLHARMGRREATATVDLSAVALPTTLAVSDHGVVSCVGRPCDGQITVAPASHLRMQTDPGTVADLGGQRLTADAHGKIDAAGPGLTRPSVDQMPLSTLCPAQYTPVQLGSSHLTLTFADKTQATATIPLATDRLASDLGDALGPVARGPVHFPWEKAGAPAIPPALHAALFLSPLKRCSGAGPKTATLADVVVVAISTHQNRTDTCTYALSHENGGAAAGEGKATLTMYDENATAYSRLTGQKLGTRVFQAPKDCASHITTEAGGSLDSQGSFVNGATVAAWALTLAR